MSAGYATVDDLRSRLGIVGSASDPALTAALAAAQGDVEQDTGRRFDLATTATARVFNPQYRIVPSWDGEKLLVDDIGDETGLLIEVGSGTNWLTVVDWDTGPENAISRGEAVTWILRPYLPWVTWPRQRVRITAKWGWPAVPAQIHEATLLRAARLFRRKDSPDGIAGSADFGPVRVGRSDPDYDSLVCPFVIPGVG